MALVDEGFFLHVTLIDQGSKQATLTFDLRAVTHANAMTAASSILTTLNAITEAEVKAYSVTNRWVENALALPTNNTKVSDRASVIVQLASSPLKRSQIIIPAPVDAIFMAPSGSGWNKVDVTNEALQGYVAMFAAAGEASISDGEAVAITAENGGIVDGVRTTRRSYRD